MKEAHILLVDDEQIILKSLSRELQTSNYQVETATSGEEALALLEDSTIDFDLVVTDLLMEGMDGIEVLKQVKQRRPELGVIILTGHGDLHSAIDAVRFGADDYLLKPCEIEELLFRIANYLEQRASGKGSQPRTDGPASQRESSRIIGRHHSMRELQDLITEAAGVDLPVLIQGESGTGKELVARQIHEASLKEKPFIAVNCAALPQALLESELFGHVKGAFTGAIRDKKGRFELADGGTVFLDEIGEMDPAVQVKLLRVLQEKTFERVGGTRTIKVNVRLISATNRDLDEEVPQGKFRLDLFYRLCVVPIRIPPLRLRTSDIPLLVENFIARFGKAQPGTRLPRISPRVLALLESYSWPGNVRELQNVIQFSLMKCKEASTITEEHLPRYLEDNCLKIALHENGGSRRKLDEQSVREALRKTGGNKLEAARELGVARATLYRFINDKLDNAV